MEGKFSIKVGSHDIVGDIVGVDERPSVVFLHGAGESHRKRFDPVRDLLAAAGIASVAFDFGGAGESSGELSSFSLKDRVDQACAVIDALQLPQPLSLIGSSMGAYVAVKLTEIFKIRDLILFVPAMYDRKAYDVPFNAGFTTIIRRPGSWRDSDAWDLLRAFRGNILVFAGGRDEVIPKELIAKIDEAPQARSRRTIVFEEADHLIGRHFAGNPAVFDVAGAEVVSLLRQHE